MPRTDVSSIVSRALPVVRGSRYSVLALLSTILLACTPAAKDTGGTGPGPSGTLAVQVGGLPVGVGARVTVTGPAGYSQILTATAQLSGVAVGVYHVTADYVNAAGQVWTGLPSPDSVFINAGETVAVAVTYTGSPVSGLNLRVAGVQLIQSTQRADGAVPMVANRNALLRVFVVANAPNTAAPTVRVRLFSGASQVDSVDVVAPSGAVSQTVDTATLSASWNVLIPAARVAGGFGYQVAVDPGDAIAESDETDNRWPGASGVQAVTVRTVPTLNLRFIPVKQSVNNLTGQVNAANKDAFAEMTRRIYPLSTVNVDVRAVYTTAAPALDANDNSGAWGQILSETSALQASDGSSSDYVSIVPTTYSSGIAGLGWIGAPAAVAWDKASSAPGVIAHEIGHNFGRLHAPCGSPSGPDPSYPYLNAGIGSWGIDLPALSLKPPTAIKDLMSYCHPEWVSDYTYLGVLNFRGSTPAVQTAQLVGSGLLVWGRIRDGQVILEPAFMVEAPARLPARPGPEQITGLDAAGNRVFSLSFAGELVPDLPSGEERQFAYVVPLSEGDRTRLAGLRLTGRGLTALRAPTAALRASGAASSPAVTATRVGGDTELRWDRAWPMAIIRDARTGEILALARDGSSRVSAGGGVRVDLTDGVMSRVVQPTSRP
jgi:hypothetical protein